MPRLAQREQYRLLQMDFGEEKWTDITYLLADDDLVVEESSDEIDMMTFTVDHDPLVVELFISWVFRGLPIRFKGGYLKGSQRWLFDGVVSHWEPIFGDNGRLKCKVTCYDKAYELQLSIPGNITYPAATPTVTQFVNRTFHVRKEATSLKSEYTAEETSITLSEIVTGILMEFPSIKIAPPHPSVVGECRPIGGRNKILVNTLFDWRYTHIHPIVQNETESDYHFIQRLLTGKSGGRGELANEAYSDRDTMEEPFVHGHCMFYMGTNGSGKEPESLFYVLPEEYFFPKDENNKPVEEAGKIEFVFHNANGLVELVNPETFDPSAENARMPIINVTIRENPDRAQGLHRIRVKEVPARDPKLQKGKKTGLTAPPGETSEVEEGVSQIWGREPPGGWGTWEPDRDKILAEAGKGSAGEFGDMNELSAIDHLRDHKKWPWKRAMKYYKIREALFSASNRQFIPGDDEDPFKVDDSQDEQAPPPGSKKGKDWLKAQYSRPSSHYRAVKKRRYFFGMYLTFKMNYGNPHISAKKVYWVDGVTIRYNGMWFMNKVKHIFGKQYTSEIEMTR